MYQEARWKDNAKRKTRPNKKPNHKWPLHAFNLFWAFLFGVPKVSTIQQICSLTKSHSCHSGRHFGSSRFKTAPGVCIRLQSKESDFSSRNRSVQCLLLFWKVCLHTVFSTRRFIYFFLDLSILMPFHCFSAHSRKSHFCSFLAIFSFFSTSIVITEKSTSLSLSLKRKKMPGHFAWTGALLFIVCGSLVAVFSVNPRASIPFQKPVWCDLWDLWLMNTSPPLPQPLYHTSN